MEKKKTSIRIAQESRKKNNETGYFTGYITVLNGMSAFALAAAWGWGMSEIFRIEMDTKVILLGLLLISMLFSAGYGMSRVGGIGAGLGAAAAGIWYKWDICVGMGRRVFGQLRQGTAGDAEHLYQNIEMDTISVLVLTFWIFLLNRRQTVKVFSLPLIKLRWLFLLVTQVSGCRMLGIRLRMEQMKCGLLRVIRMLIIMRPIMCSMIKVVPQAFILPLIPALSVVIHA